MRNNTSTTIAVLLAVAVLLAADFAAPADAGVVLRPTSVTGTIAGDAGSSVGFLIADNAGSGLVNLQWPVGTPVTLPTGSSAADALATFAERSGGGQAESWTRGTSLGNPVFSFDLGADNLVLGSILLWQYGNNGGGAGKWGNDTRDFELIFHTEVEGSVFSFASGGGTEATEFAGTMLTGGINTAANGAQRFSFDPQAARYVGLRIASNYQGQPGISAGGTRFGLGEVRFMAVPEPTTLLIWSLLAGLGVGLGWRRRG